MSLRKLADVLGVHHATIGRWETGKQSPKVEDVASYLTAVGVNGDAREQVIDLARDTDGPRWLSVGMPEQQRQLAALLEFERTVRRITDVSPLLIPGLLQISDYARAIMVSGGVPAAEIETRVAVRVGRREALHRDNPANLVTLVGESALRTMIGGQRVMAAQLRYLAKEAKLPNVDLRVVPIAAGWNPGLEGPFTVLEFDNNKPSPVVHLEMRESGLFLHEPENVESYRQAADKVLRVAMSPVESSRLIADAIDRMETT